MRRVFVKKSLDLNLVMGRAMRGFDIQVRIRIHTYDEAGRREEEGGSSAVRRA